MQNTTKTPFIVNWTDFSVTKLKELRLILNPSFTKVNTVLPNRKFDFYFTRYINIYISKEDKLNLKHSLNDEVIRFETYIQKVCKDYKNIVK